MDHRAAPDEPVPAAGRAAGALPDATIVPATPKAIEAAALRLRAGGLVAFATETVYGLGADAADATAVAAVYAAKGRPADHPLIVHVGSAQAAAWWAPLPPAAQRLASAFWPGPLTLILHRRDDAPAYASAGQPTIGLRCPSHPVAQALLAAFHALGGRGVAAPSANRFGRISPTTARHVLDDLGERAPPILDGGGTPVGIESTIVDLSRGRAVVLRPGAVSAEAIAEAIGAPVDLSANVIDPRVTDAAAPRASGTLASHYAPRTPLEVADGPDGVAARVEVLRAAGRRAAVWSFGAVPAGCVGQTAPGDPERYAQRLYAVLRELDATGCDAIVVEAPPRDARWRAVWDRLARAAAR